MESFIRGRMMVSMAKQRKLSPPKEVMNSDEYVCRWLKKHKIWLRNHEGGGYRS